jgi:hypothetical protein
MNRGRRVMLIVLAIVLPVALALGAYLISAGVGASAGVVPVPAGGAFVSVQPSEGPSPSDDRASHATPSVSPSDDHSGKCLEPEHVNDPSCSSGSGRGGSSGSGSGSGHGSGGGDD